VRFHAECKDGSYDVDLPGDKMLLVAGDRTMKLRRKAADFAPGERAIVPIPGDGNMHAVGVRVEEAPPKVVDFGERVEGTR
jgi:hypothetical protein